MKTKQRSYTYADSGDENVVAAVLGSIVRAPMPINAPVTWERRGHALCARTVRVAVEEREVCGHKVRPRRHAHRQLCRKVICKQSSTTINNVKHKTVNDK